MKKKRDGSAFQGIVETLTRGIRHLILTILFCAGTAYVLYTFEVNVSFSKKHQTIKQKNSMMEKGSKLVKNAVNVYKVAKNVF